MKLSLKKETKQTLLWDRHSDTDREREDNFSVDGNRRVHRTSWQKDQPHRQTEPVHVWKSIRLQPAKECEEFQQANQEGPQQLKRSAVALSNNFGYVWAPSIVPTRCVSPRYLSLMLCQRKTRSAHPHDCLKHITLRSCVHFRKPLSVNTVCRTVSTNAS